MNYAWSKFGGDFGGVAKWSVTGVSQNQETILGNLREMKANGVDVVRWWVWPELRGEGVLVDAAGTPTGLGGTAAADIDAALSLAAQAQVRLQFCLFSFDNFRPDRTDNEVFIRGMKAMVLDATKRAALMEKAVRPLVRAASASAFANRAIAWEVINEPEWAISGASLYGDQAFDPQSKLEAITHAEMETFVVDTVAAIRKETALPVTVGGAAAKWAKAWTKVDVDFYSLHIYDWVNEYWPYTRTPAELGLTGKPVVMGEFPLEGLTAVPYGTLVSTLYDKGYAGAMGWSFTDAVSPYSWAPSKANVKTFAESKGCRVAY